MESKSYQQLVDRFHEVYLLSSSVALLQWDAETYLHAKGVRFRADQIAYLASKAHALATAPEIGNWLQECEDHGYAQTSDEGANVREWRRAYDRAKTLPVAFVEEYERHCALSRDAWKAARAASDFNRFASFLQKIVDLNREKAERIGFAEVPYDALMDEFEPGVKTKLLQPVFAELRAALVSLLQSLGAKKRESLLRGHFPLAGQQALSREIATAFGYDFGGGRIDVSAHPFQTSLGPDDHRITTRYNEEDFTVALYGTMHETGHALYEQGLLTAAAGTPVGSSVSLGIHESQSRLWENHVGRSLLFWQHWHTAAARHLPVLADVSPEQLSRGTQQVAPSWIRVEADEVTYDLHILLRFELELAIIHAEIEVADLPHLWNERFRQMFGLAVPDDARGVLQDIHWSLGAFGYFPTYTLGNLNAAQLMAAAERQLPELNADLASGNYATLLQWLRQQVHQHGKRYTSAQLMERVTGSLTMAKFRIAYLREKYGA